MATAKQKPETSFRVTLVVPASQIEAAAKQVGGATVERVEKIEPFVEGEWSEALFPADHYDEKRRGKARDGEWVSTDGRRIQRHKSWLPDEEKKPLYKRVWGKVYRAYDQYGLIGMETTLDKARRLVRPVSTTEETLKEADLLALRITRSGSYDADQYQTAERYLAMRRFKAAQEPMQDEDRRRKPVYEITLTAEGSSLDYLTRLAQEAFGKDVGVAKVPQGYTRDEDLERAADFVEEAKKIVGELKGDLEDWKDNLPDNFREQKEEELDSAISELESIENGLNISFDNVEFPGVY